MTSADSPAGPTLLRRPGRLRLQLAVLLSVAMLAAGAFLMFGRRGATLEPYGVRLGFSMGDTRDRFAAPPGGSWSHETNPVRLTWTAGQGDSAPAPSVRAARFEFHQGMLVAGRFSLAVGAPFASGPPLEIGRTQLVSRASTPGGVTLTVLSRDCPEHAEEVRAMLGAKGGQ